MVPLRLWFAARRLGRYQKGLLCGSKRLHFFCACVKLLLQAILFLEAAHSAGWLAAAVFEELLSGL